MQCNFPVVAVALLLSLAGCSMNREHNSPAADRFADDVAFIERHTPLIVLESGDAKVAVAPALQGRVMTATTGRGESFGWINREYFAEAAAGKTNPHISPYGGADRFWLGPEGGQYSIFFKSGDPFDFAHWHTPAFIDTEPFETVKQGRASAEFRRDVSFANYNGTKFDARIDRTIRVLSPADAWKHLDMPAADGIRLVAFESDNRLTNAGKSAWTKDGGLLSIWILGMLNASPRTTVVIPVNQGDESKLGPPVNDDYFGKVPADRLTVKDGVVYFKADANRRSKIGTSPGRTKPVAGSYDAQSNVLTIVQFTFDPSAKRYVNSAWKMQDDPHAGDVLNSYNDGPAEPGKPQMGKFYEIESSSPARELKPGESMRHVHRTIHLTGDRGKLDEVAMRVLGVSLDHIERAL